MGIGCGCAATVAAGAFKAIAAGANYQTELVKLHNAGIIDSERDAAAAQALA